MGKTENAPGTDNVPYDVAIDGKTFRVLEWRDGTLPGSGLLLGTGGTTVICSLLDGADANWISSSTMSRLHDALHKRETERHTNEAYGR